MASANSIIEYTRGIELSQPIGHSTMWLAGEAPTSQPCSNLDNVTQPDCSTFFFQSTSNGHETPQWQKSSASYPASSTSAKPATGSPKSSTASGNPSSRLESKSTS